MENLFRDKKGIYAFTMLMILFVLMVVGLILSQSLVRLTLPAFFGISDPDLFITTPAEQIKNPLALMYFQAMCSSIGFFLLPVIAYHVIFGYDIASSMGMRKIPSVKYWLLGIGVMFMSAIFIQLLVQINSAIPLSGKLQSLRTGQDEVQKMVEAFFSESSRARFLTLTLVMALLPAIGEELCFRGTIQTTLYQTNLGPVGAVIVSGLTFSLVHFEFDNFLAIWCMGIVLGFLYYYSGSIWVSIGAHFFNNFIVVVGKYAYMKGLVHTDVANNDTLPVYLTIPAGVAMVLGLMLLRKWRNPKTPNGGFNGQVNASIGDTQ